MKDKPETLIQPTMDIKWNSGNLLDMEAHMPSTTQNNSKRTKRNNQERRNCCDHSREVDDRVVGQQYSTNLPNRLVNWVAVTPALTRFTKKSEFILCSACVVVGHKMWSC